MDFKANFHHVSIRAPKDPTQIWYDLPYLATDDSIDAVLDHCLVECHTIADLVVGGSKFVA